MGKGGYASKTKEISAETLATKNTINECWIAYEGGVYDVTHWLAKHPGGVRAIMSAGGQDASSVMKSLHTPDTLKTYMKRIRKIGVLVDDNPALETSTSNTMKKKIKALERNARIHQDFAELNERLIREGWYEATPMRYWAPILRASLLITIGVSLVLLTQEDIADEYPFLISKCGLTLGSFLIGFFFKDIAFIGHDAGHGSITNSFSTDAWLGFIIGNLLTGIDIGWWKSTHYVHHSATNSLHDDPDIQHMPLICFEERFTQNLWSSYHGRFMGGLDAVGRAVLPYQHWYYFPVMGVARINLYIQSIIHLVNTCPLIPNKKGESVIDERTGEVKEKFAWIKPSLPFWSAQVISLCGFYFGGYSFLSRLDMKTALICFAISHFTAGLLHVQILLSHAAMHYCTDGPGTIDAPTAPNGNDEAGYYEWQALSTMDVDCPPWMDWFHGGLQFQLEHHLFPRVPRWRLRELCPLTDEIFRKYDVPVVRIPFIEANCLVLKHLANVGAKLSKTKTV